jgi:hypothetical protein
MFHKRYDCQAELLQESGKLERPGIEKTEIRNPKSESNPKPETRIRRRDPSDGPIRISGFLPSFGFLISGFGFCPALSELRASSAFSCKYGSRILDSMSYSYGLECRKAECC